MSDLKSKPWLRKPAAGDIIALRQGCALAEAADVCAGHPCQRHVDGVRADRRHARPRRTQIRFFAHNREAGNE